MDNSYKEWLEHTRTGDGMLYNILEGCLNFHNFLLMNDEHQTAFKGICRFNWHKSTSLLTLVAKQVFGSHNKQVYGYIKALNAALAQGIGTDGTVGMAQWLKQNGGVAGVVRATDKQSKAEIERSYRIHVARNGKEFGLLDRISSFNSPQMAAAIEHGSGDVVILATVNRATGDFQPKFMTEYLPIRHKLWEMYGEAIMSTPNYHKKKDAFIGKIREANSVRAAEIEIAFKKVVPPKKVEEHTTIINNLCVNG